MSDSSARPYARSRGNRTLLAMIRKVGEERVRWGPEGEPEKPMTRGELLARVLWARAIADGDLAAARLLIDCLEGKLSERAVAQGELRGLTADDFAEMEKRWRAWTGDQGEG